AFPERPHGDREVRDASVCGELLAQRDQSTPARNKMPFVRAGAPLTLRCANNRKDRNRMTYSTDARLAALHVAFTALAHALIKSEALDTLTFERSAALARSWLGRSGVTAEA